jgi:DNA polymerase II large subunit
VYEQQLREYLNTFTIPVDYQLKIIEAQQKLESFNDIESQRKTLESRLGKAKELYEWGHKTKKEYFADYVIIQRELRQL